MLLLWCMYYHNIRAFTVLLPWRPKYHRIRTIPCLYRGQNTHNSTLYRDFNMLLPWCMYHRINIRTFTVFLPCRPKYHRIRAFTVFLPWSNTIENVPNTTRFLRGFYTLWGSRTNASHPLNIISKCQNSTSTYREIQKLCIGWSCNIRIQLSTYCETQKCCIS